VYATDTLAWYAQQAGALRQQQPDYLDWENIAEELEDMGRRLQRQLRSRLKILLMHCLKWDYQSDKRSRSWATTIVLQQQEIVDLLADSPSLKPEVEDLLAGTYPQAVALAVAETGMSHEQFPEHCPYTLEGLLAYEASI
jgi:hypothetical protein